MQMFSYNKTITVFTDAATSPQSCVAVGAFLYIEQNQLDQYANCKNETLAAKISNQIMYTEFKSKKSTWSEIKTIITALNLIHEKFGLACHIKIYTDCQSICDLLTQRKERLKKNNFMTRAGKVLGNADLYRELFALTEKFTIQIFKVKGHTQQTDHLSLTEKIFSIVDKLSRKKLRLILYPQKNSLL